MTAMEAVIGLEVHVRLATRTKLFSRAAFAFGGEPNSQVEPVSLGLPGSLPVLNDRALDLALTAALALDCEIRPHSKFDRKHYFYPDLPKNYQISQYDEPFCRGGGVDIDLADGGTRRIPLTRIHLEEDAGKLVHQQAGTCSEVDLNRAGTPLIEIVTEPAIASPEEAYAFLIELKRTLGFCAVSDCEMQEGSLRCDVNVSVRPAGQTELGTKVEVKNLNSFRAVAAALAAEIEHQSSLHAAGREAELTQETKLWDPDAGVTRSMRGKEGDADYRYFPDPDLPPLEIAPDRIERLRAALPELPRARQERFVSELGLRPQVAAELTTAPEVADYFEALVADGVSAKDAANWTREEALRRAAETRLPVAEAAPREVLAAIIGLVSAGKVARVVAKGECEAIFAGGTEPEVWFTERGMIQEQNADQLAAWLDRVFTEEAAVVADVRNGNPKAIGRLIGRTMKMSGGKADPKAVKAEIERRLA